MWDEVSQASSGKYGTEFASETDVQHVKRQNAQANKNKN
ncbi:gamma-type small acid-soluble spore protein [Priestia aryabhattai]